MLNELSRLELLLEKEQIDKIKSTRVAVFGLGGVGGYVIESLARSGFSDFVLIDNDTFSITNLNRQILSTHESVGRKKTEVAKERILAINPNAKIEIHDCFYLPETKDEFDFSEYDYVVDAIDTVTGKISIIEECSKKNVKVISSMGCGNRFDPSKLKLADISKTSMDPLAKVMRRELKKRKIYHCPVLFSLEKPHKPLECKGEIKENPLRRSTPGSSAFVPSVGGIMIAYWIFKDVTGVEEPTC